MENMLDIAILKEEVEMLGYFVTFAPNAFHEERHRQIHVFKDSRF